MARRYSRILDGARLNTGLENYIEHVRTAGTRERNLGTRPSYNYVQVFVYPFGMDLVATTNRVAAQARDTSRDILAPLINDASTGCQVDVATSAANVQSVPNFKPARVTWGRATSKVKRVERSEITQLQYLTYENVTNYSCPFGRSAETDNVYDCFVALKSLLKSQEFAVNRVSLKEENITYQ